MGLVVNFKTVQQTTILVTLFQIRRYIQDYRHRASLILLLQLPVLFLLQYCITSIVLLLFLIASQLLNLITKYQQQKKLQLVILELSYLPSQLAQHNLRGKTKYIHGNVSQFIYVGSELLILAGHLCMISIYCLLSAQLNFS